ncbi:MAG TPA: 3'(2'),5'-bisphosphate nucleotidase CysQ [Polyangia bacterium]|nr:3'(2'),5'-bisphosphate nucleotidase CysQ [Polyangia bacterium]
MPVETYERELEVAKATAREAGAIIMRHYARPDIDVNTKADKSPVTAADLDANAAIIKALAAAFPDDAILTEETPDDQARLQKRRVWIIDPLDGTRDFVARTGDFCVHIGFAVDGEAVMGVVYQPTVGSLAFAVRGGGAFEERDGQTSKLAASTLSAANKIRIGVSRLNLDEGLGKCLAAAGMVDRAVRLGASVKHIALARGDLDAVLNLSPSEQEWDTCAPEVIMREAGCRVTNGDGAPFRYNQPDLFRPRGSAASNGHCHALVLRVMAPCLPVP